MAQKCTSSCSVIDWSTADAQCTVRYVNLQAEDLLTKCISSIIRMHVCMDIHDTSLWWWIKQDNGGAAKVHVHVGEKRLMQRLLRMMSDGRASGTCALQHVQVACWSTECQHYPCISTYRRACTYIVPSAYVCCSLCVVHVANVSSSSSHTQMLSSWYIHVAWCVCMCKSSNIQGSTQKPQLWLTCY